MEHQIMGCIDDLCDLAILSVEFDSWPELQALVAEADTVSAFESLDLLRRLKTEIATSVEMGDWVDLQDALDDAHDVLAKFS